MKSSIAITIAGSTISASKPLRVCSLSSAAMPVAPYAERANPSRLVVVFAMVS